jgi:hypothetical protein
VEAGGAELALDVAAAVAVAAFQAAVQDDVREDAAAKAVAEREKPAALVRLHSLERAAQPGLERHAAVRLQEERIEVERAELPVAGPRLSRPEPLEGAHVDEDRPRPAPLDVVRRRVLRDEVLGERRAQELELEERRVPEHPERPLVGIGDEGDALVSEDGGVAVFLELSGQAVFDPLGRDERALRGRPPEELALGERLPVGQAALGERAEHSLARVENAAVRVPKRSCLESGAGRVRYRSSSFFRMPKKPSSRRQ